MKVIYLEFGRIFTHVGTLEVIEGAKIEVGNIKFLEGQVVIVGLGIASL